MKLRRVHFFCCKCLLTAAILAFGRQLSAQQLLERTVDAHFQEKTLEEIFDQLESTLHIPFYFQADQLPATRRTFRFSNTTLEKALAQLLEGTPLGVSTYADYAVIIARKEALAREFDTQFRMKQYASMLERATLQTPSAELIVVGDSTRQAAGGEVLLRGTISDRVTKEPLIGASLFFEPAAKGTTTEVDGTFQLALPQGEHFLTVQAVSYREVYKKIRIFSDGEITIKLDVQTFDLQEVVVAATTNDANIRSAQTGLAQLSMTDIKEIPSLLGESDVIRGLLTLPGVTNTGEGAGGFHVRGGAIDQNLIMLDGATVFNSSHVLGFFSIFNGDVVDKVTLYKGNIPAQFGGRAASVLDVRTKDGHFSNWQGQGGLGLVASRLTLEGPVVKDQTSVIVSGRTSYSDWALNLAENPDVNNSSARFYDLTAKITQRLGKNGTLSLTGYRSDDFFRFAGEFGYEWTTGLLSLKWQQILTDQLSSSLEASAGDYRSQFFQPQGADAFRLQTGNRSYKWKQNFFLNPGEKHRINAGVEWQFFDSRPEQVAPYSTGAAVIPDRVEKEQGRELAFYINEEAELSDLFSFSVGLRYSIFQNIGPYRVFSYDRDQTISEGNITGNRFFEKNQKIRGYAGLEPRVALKIGLASSASLKLSYNRLRQYNHLVSNTAATTPVDIWQLSNRYVQPLIADNFSLGYFRNFRNNRWETSIESFYRNLNNVLEFRDFADLFLNEHLETELLRGRGRAYGVELGIRKTAGKWSGSMAYTWSRTERRVMDEARGEAINGGAWYPANFDQPHQVSLLAKYKPNKWKTLSLSFTYATGRPITAPVSTYLVGNIVVPNYSDRNQFRIPDYHRLDLSYTIRAGLLKRKNYKGSLTFAIYNIYFRKNAFAVFFRRQPGFFFPDAFRLATLGTIFPAITYNFEF